VKKIFEGPDEEVMFFRKLFNVNNRLLQLTSLLAFALLIYDIGFKTNPQEGLINTVYSFLLLLLSFGYAIRLFSKSEKYSLARYFVEILIICFLVFAALVNLQVISSFFKLIVADVYLKSFLVNALIVTLFLIELSKLLLDINQLKLHPALVFILSFIIIIVVGTGMLLLPNSTSSGISVVDALFTSTSAVCVTGLIVLDTSSDFTFLGQFIIMILFQIGGLGMMTFTSFFGFFFKGSYTLQSQLFLKDYINEENISSINKTLIRIIIFTLLVETAAAISIYSLIDNSLFEAHGDWLFFSIFHAISAFCNAGFSTLGNGLFETGFHDQYNVHLIIAFTIILGGIGFPVVMGYYNYYRHVFTGIKKVISGVEKYRHAPRVVNIHIRLIVITTFILLATGFITFLIFEQQHSLKGLGFYEKMVTAFFGSVTPRTAGFNTVDMEALAMPTILIYLILMWIGASPGSTGGGLKTSTFAVAVLNTISIAKGKNRVEVFNRQITNETIRKAFSVILLSFIIIGLGVFLVLLFNPEMELVKVAFEVFSAFSTVGLSLGITSDLSIGSKLVITIIMFLGRVGTLTVLVAFIRKARTLNYKYPEESVFIL
jgi:trk system potassium uptake protein